MKGKMGGLNGRVRNIKTEMPRFDPRSLLFLKESEINYFNAVYDMLVYKVDYLKAIGSLVK